VNANRVKSVKWLFLSFLFLCSGTFTLWADEESDLLDQGRAALVAQNYDLAAQTFDRVLAANPGDPNINNVRIQAGYAYLYGGKFTEAVDRLSKVILPSVKPEERTVALYFTGLAQFSAAQKSTDPGAQKTLFGQAVTNLTSLIDLISPAPKPTDHLEDAMYYRALAELELGNAEAGETDLLQLTQQFGSSLNRPDYLLRLGGAYAMQTSNAVNAKESSATIQALVDKALNAFDQVSKDPNGLVQANQANLDKAEMLFLVAQADSSPESYEKALEAYRQVHRKDDMILLQQQRLDDQRNASQTQLQNAAGSTAEEKSLLLAREEARLNQLKTDPDPIIEALLRIAECYIAMKQPDEGRTILHRLVAHAPLTPEQHQEVDLQILFSYVLGGQIAAADKALTDYLGKHAGDPQADSISYQIAAKLLGQKDYAGALAQDQRSLRDFPHGKSVGDVMSQEAEALTGLGRIAESAQVIEDFLKQNPTSPQANSLLLSRAQDETKTGNLAGALADYQRVKTNGSAGADLQAAADGGYIETLQALGRYDDVINESKAFASSYPNNPSAPGILVIGGMAMDAKHDPGAVAALQDVAQKYPTSPSAPVALYNVLKIYERARNVPAVLQTMGDLRRAYPDNYPVLVAAADEASVVLLKLKKFDEAVALYQPWMNAPDTDIAAAAHNKIGDIDLASAKALGHYESMQLAARTEAEKRLSSAEQAYLGTLKMFPNQLDAVSGAIDGLINVLKQRRSWGLLTDATMEAYLAKLSNDVTDADMRAHFELAKAGLVFVYRDGAKQYAAALARFKQTVAANPGLHLTRAESNQLGELLLAAKDYSSARKTYNDLLANAAPGDVVSQGDAYYGLGATYLAQGDVAQARDDFNKLLQLPGGGRWHPHILDAEYGVALAGEQGGAAEQSEAQQLYGQIMQAPQAEVALQAKAMLGYGRLLEKSGYALKPSAAGPTEYAVHYYLEPNTLFGPATPEQSAEGLFDAGQAYQKAGDAANAKKQYDALLGAYSTTAPDWAAKARATEAQAGG
jgi:tetratricopeptide (TPR) repeat protein